MNRDAFIELLVGRIEAITCSHPVRVAIDGVDGVGKTMLADELAVALSDRGRQVIRASVDSFHNPKSVRYSLGRNSPEGYFRDSFNYSLLTCELLGPLGPDGSLHYRPAVFDHRTDSAIAVPVDTADRNAILLFDGIFLHRPELSSYWDFSVFLDAPFEVTIARAAARDDTSPDVDAPENQRYVQGQQLYLQTCEPKRSATMVIDNEDLVFPKIIIVK